MVLNYPVLYKSQDARADAIVAQAVATAIGDATTLWSPEPFDGVFPVKGFGIARLKAADVRLRHTLEGSLYSNFWGVSINTASTWETYWDNTLSDSCYVIITGIYCYDADPDVTEIKFIAEGIEYPVINIQEMYGWDIAVAYFSHPIIVRPKKALRVKVKAITAGQKKLGFIGYTVGTRSYLITEA